MAEKLQTRRFHRSSACIGSPSGSFAVRASSFVGPTGVLFQEPPTGASWALLRIHVRTRQAYDDTQVRAWNSCRHLCCGVCLRGLLDQACALGAAFRAGDTVICLEQEPGVVVDAGVHGLGRRYITVQVFKVDEVHARMIAPGAREASAPKTGGTTPRISIVLDPDGNWIELSQRASIVGTLT
jgi:hypothetical protein